MFRVLLWFWCLGCLVFWLEIFFEDFEGVTFDLCSVFWR